MDQIRQQLAAAAVAISAYVEDGNRIRVGYLWGLTARGVTGIRVTLSGKDHLTGEPIDEEEIAWLGPTASGGTSRALPYDGKFFLRFDALDSEGRVLVRDFREKKPVELNNPPKRATIRYSAQQARHGWQRLVIETNCPVRCLGKLWALCNGHYQMLPRLASGENVLYFPAGDRSIELVFDEAESEGLRPIDIKTKG